jgi:hypothetical protein
LENQLRKKIQVFEEKFGVVKMADFNATLFSNIPMPSPIVLNASQVDNFTIPNWQRPKRWRPLNHSCQCVYNNFTNVTNVTDIFGNT